MWHHYIYITIITLLSGGVVLVAGDSTPPTSMPAIDYQKTADDAGWEWYQNRANPLGTMAGMAATNYDVILFWKHDHPGLQIQILKNGLMKYQWWGNRFSVYRIVGDRLFFIDFNPQSEGGTVVSIDLKREKELWKSPLVGLGQMQHSGYVTMFNLRANRDVITIYGNETGGRYIEFKDVTTGKTVGHKVFKRNMPEVKSQP